MIVNRGVFVDGGRFAQTPFRRHRGLTVDGSEIRLTSWDENNRLKKWHKLPTSTGDRRISEPSTVGINKMVDARIVVDDLVLSSTCAFGYFHTSGSLGRLTLILQPSPMKRKDIDLRKPSMRTWVPPAFVIFQGFGGFGF